ncbi:hypothetical protein BHE74_00051301, partial [Ensete ventricosum]
MRKQRRCSALGKRREEEEKRKKRKGEEEKGGTVTVAVTVAAAVRKEEGGKKKRKEEEEKEEKGKKGLWLCSDDVVGSRRKFAKRFIERTEKLAGNAKGDRWKEDRRTCRKITGGCRSMR